MKQKEISPQERFIRNFDLPKDGFSEPTPFIEGGLGFSTLKNRVQNGCDFASLYKFYIPDSILKEDTKIKPITVGVHYGEKREDGISLTPKDLKRKASWPIDLISTDEFFYDIESNRFFYKEEEISPSGLLKLVEKWHTQPTKFFNFIKLKIWVFRYFLPFLLEFLYGIQKWVLYLISGIKIKEGIRILRFKQDRAEDDIKHTRARFAHEEIKILGYTASAWSVVAYSVLHLAIFIVWNFYPYEKVHPAFIPAIFSNAFLIIVYTIPSLVIFEKLLPTVLERGMSYTSLLMTKSVSKRIKVS